MHAWTSNGRSSIHRNPQTHPHYKTPRTRKLSETHDPKLGNQSLSTLSKKKKPVLPPS